MLNIDELVKSPKFRHAPAFAGAGSAKAGIQYYLITLNSRFPDCVTIGKTTRIAVSVIPDLTRGSTGPPP